MLKPILLLVMMATSQAINYVPTVRQNVGAIYEPLPEPLVNGHDTTTMLLVIPYHIPDPPETKSKIKDQVMALNYPTLHDDRSNSQILQQAEELDLLMNITETEINATIESVHLFLSNPINNHGRYRRAPFGFLAPLFRGAIGLATLDDVKGVMDQIKNIDGILEAFSKQDKEAAILIDSITDRQDKFMKTYINDKNIMDQTITTLGQSINLWALNMTTSLNSFANHENTQRRKIQILTDALTIIVARMNYLQALQRTTGALRMLSSGIMTADIVPPAELASHLNDLDMTLRLHSPGSKVAITDLDYYYSQRMMSYTYSESHIYIHLDIIVASTVSTFRVFQLVTTPVPINPEETPTKGVTQLITEVKFLAVSEDGSLFLELTNADMLTCPGEKIKICTKTSPRVHRHVPTCTVAIYLNKAKQVKDMCQFTISPLKRPISHAVAISQDEYLVTTNSPTYTVTCHGKPATTHKAQSHSIIGVPCLCTVNIDHYSLPNSRLPCNTTISFHYVLKTINLPFLSALNKIKESTPDSRADLPSFPKVNLSRTLDMLRKSSNIDESTLLDLNPFAKTLLDDASSLAKPLENRLIESYLYKIARHPAASIIPMILSIIATILATYTLFKVHRGSAVLAYMPAAKAYRFVTDKPMEEAFHSIFQKEATTAPMEQGPTPILTIQETHTLIIAILFTITIYSAYRLTKYLKSLATKHCGKGKVTKRTNPTVILKVYKGDTNFTFPLRPVPHEFDTILKASAPTYRDLIIKMYPLPRLLIEWNGPVVITTKKGESAYLLPETINLPWRARFSIIPALREPNLDYAMLLQNDITPVPVTMDHQESKLQNIIIDDQRENTNKFTEVLTMLTQPPTAVTSEKVHGEE